MESLKKVKELYDLYISQWCNKENAAERAVEEVFVGKHKYITKNEYSEPLYVYDGDYVLFFDGCIYKSMANN